MLYCGNDDEKAFDAIKEAFGGVYDVIGYLFFIHDSKKYLPISSGNFDKRFAQIGIDYQTSGKCSWENYKGFIHIIRGIRDYMQDYYDIDGVTLLDAHSFVWMFWKIDEYYEKSAAEPFFVPVQGSNKSVETTARIGQSQYRKNLLKFWNNKCSVTGCENTGFLTASHIKPWRDSNPDEKGDVYNGLLLTPNLDAAFDQGYITFDDNGHIIISNKLSVSDCMILAFCSCSNSTETDNDGQTMQEDDSQYGVIETAELSDTYENGAYRETLQKYDDFAIRFMKHTVTEDDNEIISPLSLYYAMAILANGANGQSRGELESYLGMTVNDLNAFLSAMDQDNSGYTTYYKKANALWFNTSHGLKLNEEFRNTVATYYGDSIFEEDFKDGKKLVADANRWSAKQTDGAIDHILEDDEINQDGMFLILNALVSGEKWLFPFDSKDTYPELFYCHDGTVKTTDMMHQSIDGYWHDSKSEGFLKSLENGTYFLAILPNEGIDIYDYLYAMNKDTFRDYRSSVVYSENMREGGTYGCIEDIHISNISFPKFRYEKEYDLNTSLKKAGLKNIFHPATADFSLMADGNQKLIDQLYVDRIKQKCSIEVNEKEVIAAAVTSVELGLGAGSCDIGKTYYHDIVFDRPFIYVLLCGDSPMFIGVVTDLGEEATGGFVIENIVGSVNIRQKPTTSSEILGETHKGNRFYAYETTEAEGYTWYRIGEDRWVADNGKWFKVVE